MFLHEEVKRYMLDMRGVVAPVDKDGALVESSFASAFRAARSARQTSATSKLGSSFRSKRASKHGVNHADD